MASQNDLVPDHSSFFILTQHHIHSPLPITPQFYSDIIFFYGWPYFLHITITTVRTWILHKISPAYFLYYITSCESGSSPRGLLHQVGSNLLTLTGLEGEREEEEEKQSKWRRRRLRGGGERCEHVGSLVSSGLPSVQSAWGNHSPSWSVSSDARVDLCNLQLNY